MAAGFCSPPGSQVTVTPAGLNQRRRRRGRRLGSQNPLCPRNAGLQQKGVTSEVQKHCHQRGPRGWGEAGGDHSPGAHSPGPRPPKPPAGIQLCASRTTTPRGQREPWPSGRQSSLLPEKRTPTRTHACRPPQVKASLTNTPSVRTPPFLPPVDGVNSQRTQYRLIPELKAPITIKSGSRRRQRWT